MDCPGSGILKGLNLAARIFDPGMEALAHSWHGLHSGNGAVLWKTATSSWCSRHYTASCNIVSLNYYRRKP